MVRAGEVVVAVGGEWGTLSEIALAKKMGTRGGSLAIPLRTSLPRLKTGGSGRLGPRSRDQTGEEGTLVRGVSRGTKVRSGH